MSWTPKSHWHITRGMMQGGRGARESKEEEKHLFEKKKCLSIKTSLQIFTLPALWRQIIPHLSRTGHNVDLCVALCVFIAEAKPLRKHCTALWTLGRFIRRRMKGNIKILSEEIEQFHYVKSSWLFSLFSFVQLVKLASYKQKEWAVFHWSCSSAVSTVTLPNTQITLLNYDQVAMCLFICCETLPPFGLCSTALTPAARAQQIGNVPRLSHRCGSLLRSFSMLILFSVLCLLLESSEAPTGALPASEWLQTGDHFWLTVPLCHSDAFGFKMTWILYLCRLQGGNVSVHQDVLGSQADQELYW